MWDGYPEDPAASTPILAAADLKLILFQNQGSGSNQEGRVCLATCKGTNCKDFFQVQAFYSVSFLTKKASNMN